MTIPLNILPEPQHERSAFCALLVVYAGPLPLTAMNEGFVGLLTENKGGNAEAIRFRPYDWGESVFVFWSQCDR
jgi:hypothetical protein